MKRKRKRPDGETGINLTPVLGIVFLILLFFVMAGPITRVNGIDFAHALCDCGPSSCDGVIVIKLDRDNRIFVEENGKPKQIDFRAVKNTVARRLAESPECGVLVQAHRHSDMGTVIRVMDQAKLARRPPPSVDMEAVD